MIAAVVVTRHRNGNPFIMRTFSHTKSGVGYPGWKHTPMPASTYDDITFRKRWFRGQPGTGKLCVILDVQASLKRLLCKEKL